MEGSGHADIGASFAFFRGGDIHIEHGEADAGPADAGENVAEEEDCGVLYGLTGLAEEPHEGGDNDDEGEKGEDGFVAEAIGEIAEELDGEGGTDGGADAGDLDEGEIEFEAFEGEGDEESSGEVLSDGEEDDKPEDAFEVGVFEWVCHGADGLAQGVGALVGAGEISHAAAEDLADEGADAAEGEEDGVAGDLLTDASAVVHDDSSDETDGDADEGGDEGATTDIGTALGGRRELGDPVAVDGADDLDGDGGDGEAHEHDGEACFVGQGEEGEGEDDEGDMECAPGDASGENESAIAGEASSPDSAEDLEDAGEGGESGDESDPEVATSEGFDEADEEDAADEGEKCGAEGDIENAVAEGAQGFESALGGRGGGHGAELGST